MGKKGQSQRQSDGQGVIGQSGFTEGVRSATGIDLTGQTGRENQANIDQLGAQSAQSREALRGFQIEDPYANTGAVSAQAGTIGDASTYDAELATAAQAQRTNLGEDTGRTNQFANLQVGTAAADLQAAQSDEALAATLESGAITGAGGATALAQAAAKSKQGVAAGLQQQEQQNSQLRAQGATSVQQEALAQRNTARQANIQQDQFNTGLQQQTNLSNQAAQNESYRFGAQAQNQFTQAQFSADNQFALQEAANLNQFEQSRADGAANIQQQRYQQLGDLYTQDVYAEQSAFQREQDRKDSNFSRVTGGLAAVGG